MTLKKLCAIFMLFLPLSGISPPVTAIDHNSTAHPILDKFLLTNNTRTQELPDIEILKTALTGYELLVETKTLRRPDIITIIDFGLPSDVERLWVIDMNKADVLFRCLVSHGRNSGEVMAEHFSNQPGSYSSSPGFYTTGETYNGKHGLSLTLDGLEKGINDKARERAIVMHGADYVSTHFIRKNGRLGRSLGCPAVPEELSKEIIETIKGGSCLFIYAPTKGYLSVSQMIKKINSETRG